MMHRLLSALSLLACLYGCAGVLMGAGSATTAVLYDERDPKIMLQDQNIVHQAYLALHENDRFARERVNVASLNHRVLLIGQVNTQAERQEAERIVANIKHVRTIINELTVGPPLATTAIAKDALLTASVKTDLLTEPGLHSVPIKIITENKVIYLMGMVSQKEASKALAVANDTTGYRRIKNLFEIVEK
jgi:osmotically-inducible protein OsmY